MKKIFFSIVALAALAACSKSEVQYENQQEIGFMAVAANITKAPVSGDVFPTDLHLYVNAYVHKATPPTTPDYISNGEFANRTGSSNWGGVNPYYWPNEQALHFSGYSQSGSFNSASYNPSLDALTIEGYNPGFETDPGKNDLMWFPSTKYTQPTGYIGKDISYAPVQVNMYHTCSWITFLVQGDPTTGSATSTYKVNSLTINGVDMTANVVCTGADPLPLDQLSTYVVWSENTTQTGTYPVTLPAGGVELKSTCTTTTTDGNTTTVYTPKNIETGATTDPTLDGNIVVIPQTPGTIDIAWTYTSTTTNSISDTATGLSLALGDGLAWEPGKHYVYTITLKANEILIAPTPLDWELGTSGNVTVE